METNLTVQMDLRLQITRDPIEALTILWLAKMAALAGMTAMELGAAVDRDAVLVGRVN
jgi:hypothetical protein